MRLIRTLAILCCLAIAGCGGGGGGVSNELSIGALSPAAIDTTVSNLPSSSGQDVALTASYSGTASGPIYVVVVDPDQVFTAAATDATVPSVVTLHLYMSGQSPMGRYTRPLTLHVCHDAACTSEYPGFPRTIQKDVSIVGTTTNVSSLNFTSTAGVDSANQSLVVTTPAGADYTYDSFAYVNYTAADGSTGLYPISSIFSITRTATGFDIRANAAYAGHYAGTLSISTPGYKTVSVNLDDQVGAMSTAVITALTTAAGGTGAFGSSADRPVYVDVRYNALPLTSGNLSIVPTGGSPDIGTTNWVRFYDQTAYTNAPNSTDNTSTLRFFLNACYYGQNCLPAGHYTANIVYSATAWDATSTVIVPVSFDITVP